MTNADHTAGGGRDLARLIGEAPWHAEDLNIGGDWMELGTVQVELAEVLAFAGRFDRSRSISMKPTPHSAE